MKQRRHCDLCAGDAAVHCAPDAAFLCWDCDAAVHGANFIVARHVRRVACAACCSLDDDRSLRVSGAGPRPSERSVLCRACDPEPPRPPSPTASSGSCLSASGSTAADPSRELAAKRVRRQRRLACEGDRAEDVLLRWSRRMGLPRWRRCTAAAAAVDAVAAVREGVVAGLPSRVALAAALWFEVKGGAADASALRRLEACSGVPARLIAVADSRIARAAGRVRVVEEGWAECS